MIKFVMFYITLGSTNMTRGSESGHRWRTAEIIEHLLLYNVFGSTNSICGGESGLRGLSAGLIKTLMFYSLFGSTNSICESESGQICFFSIWHLEVHTAHVEVEAVVGGGLQK